MNKKIPSHGGSREGSGRPGIGAQRVNVSLDEETLKRAREIGSGNVSEGLRRAISAFDNSAKPALKKKNPPERV